jgi:hypothetical protein
MTTMYLTQDDVSNYGTDLLDVGQRSALHVMAPHLQNLGQQNRELQQRLAVEARRNLDQRVAAAVPDYQEIDRDPRFHRWLLGIDVLTGRTRQTFLNDAVANGDANRIAAFFRGFQQEAGDTQQSSPTRRQAPGRRSSGRPTYTREMIGQLYEAHRKGVYVGREAEWARQEADIFAAQRAGRVQGMPYLTK